MPEDVEVVEDENKANISDKCRLVQVEIESLDHHVQILNDQMNEISSHISLVRVKCEE